MHLITYNSGTSHWKLQKYQLLQNKSNLYVKDYLKFTTPTFLRRKQTWNFQTWNYPQLMVSHQHP